MGACREVPHDIQNIIHQYAHKNNSLLAMVNDGNKGNWVKLLNKPFLLGCSIHIIILQDSIQVFSTESSILFSMYFMLRLKFFFLNGLNSQENLSHPVPCWNNSFEKNANLPSTLTRKLMFYTESSLGTLIRKLMFYTKLPQVLWLESLCYLIISRSSLALLFILFSKPSLKHMACSSILTTAFKPPHPANLSPPFFPLKAASHNTFVCSRNTSKALKNKGSWTRLGESKVMFIVP